MDVFKVSHAHSLRKGVADKPATGSEPPAGLVTFLDRMPDGKWVNLSQGALHFPFPQLLAHSRALSHRPPGYNDFA